MASVPDNAWRSSARALARVIGPVGCSCVSVCGAGADGGGCWSCCCCAGGSIVTLRGLPLPRLGGCCATCSGAGGCCCCCWSCGVCITCGNIAAGRRGFSSSLNGCGALAPLSGCCCCCGACCGCCLSGCCCCSCACGKLGVAGLMRPTLTFTLLFLMSSSTTPFGNTCSTRCGPVHVGDSFLLRPR